MTAVSDPDTVEQLLICFAPSGTGVAACRAEAALLAALTGDETALVPSAGPLRRAEFAAGRWCAHRALAYIGADARSIGRGRRGQPVWPDGATGSISHAAGLAAAVAAPTTSSIAGLGIDLELADRLDSELWSHVLTPSERTRCEVACDPVAAATTVFSAKEAAFKAFYPLLGIEIDFLEANADLEAGAGSIEIPSVGASAAVRHGRAGALVVSLAVVMSGE